MAVKRLSNSLISSSGRDKMSSFIAGYSPAVDEMDLIERVTVGAGGLNLTPIQFSNIPQTYQHLQIRGIIRQQSGDYSTATIRFNSDVATSSYATHQLYGDGSGIAAQGWASGSWSGVLFTTGPLGSASSNIFVSGVATILDYANTSKNKVCFVQYGVDGNGHGFSGIRSGVWLSTNAINSLDIAVSSYAQYSTIALYGIKG